MKVNSDTYSKAQNKYDKAFAEQYKIRSSSNISSDIYDKDPSLEEQIGVLEKYLQEKREALDTFNEIEMYKSDLEASQNEIEGAAKTFDILIKCMKIAARLISGDRVPAQDEKLLMEHYPDIYSAAKTLGSQQEKGKEHDTLIDEEEEENASLSDISDSESSVKKGLVESIEQIESAIAEIKSS